MKALIKIAALAAALTATPAQAESWRALDVDDDAVFLVDMESVTSSLVWTAIIVREAFEDGSQIIFQQHAVRCSPRQIRSGFTATYTPDGESMAEDDQFDDKWSPAVPGTNAANVIKVVCDAGFRAELIAADELPDPFELIRMAKEAASKGE